VSSCLTAHQHYKGHLSATQKVKSFAEDGPVLVAFYDSLVEKERRKRM
jgi:hypothetical protein